MTLIVYTVVVIQLPSRKCGQCEFNVPSCHQKSENIVESTFSDYFQNIGTVFGIGLSISKKYASLNIEKMLLMMQSLHD